MATSGKDLSNPQGSPPPDGKALSIGIVVGEWNPEITSSLYEGALTTLKEYGVEEKDIESIQVPGSFELPYGAKVMAASNKYDAVICLGSLIRGETIHFDVIAHATAKGVQDVSLQYGVPVIFGVLTDNTQEQARARSGGEHGNKGSEAAIAALKMARLGPKR